MSIHPSCQKEHGHHVDFNNVLISLHVHAVCVSSNRVFLDFTLVPHQNTSSSVILGMKRKFSCTVLVH